MKKTSKDRIEKQQMKSNGGFFKSINNRIGLKLNVIFSSGLLLSLIAVVFCISAYNTSAQIDIFTENCKYDLRAITSFKENQLTLTAETASKLASEKTLVNSVATGSERFIKSALSGALIDDSLDVMIVDKRGSIVYTTESGMDALAGTNGVLSAAAGAAFKGCETANNQMYALAASPLTDISGSRGAIVVISRISTDENVDNLKDNSGADFTVIVDNMRSATSIMDKSGARQAGTTISDAVYQTVNVNGQQYTGTADVLGEKYVVTYEPVFGSSGSVIGSLFTGNSLTGTYRNGIRVSIFGLIIGLAIFLLVDFILLRVVNKGIVRPLSRIVEFSKEVSSGNLGIEEPLNEHYEYNSEDEIGLVFASQEQTVSFIRVYIKEISRSLGELANGNLMFNIEQNYVGDFKEIRNSLVQVREKLAKNMSEIYKASAVLTTSSSEISSASQSLAQGATEQAGSVQELNATLETVSSNVIKNAQSAEEASRVTGNVGHEIQVGNTKVEEMMQAMRNIEESSSKIGAIIKTIEDIAFQTNILALNAAVEAARAGEAGKGFAVVADEVRNLAGKSAEAAHNTTALIQNSLALISDGAKHATETAEVMSRVVKGASTVVSTIEEISHASAEQAAAVGQIQTGMNQIAKVVHTTSATAEESAATSEELSAQAKLLEALVSTFQYQ